MQTLSGVDAIELIERGAALPMVTGDAERVRRIALLADDIATLRRAITPATSPYLRRLVAKIIDGKLLRPG